MKVSRGIFSLFVDDFVWLLFVEQRAYTLCRCEKRSLAYVCAPVSVSVSVSLSLSLPCTVVLQQQPSPAEAMEEEAVCVS